MSTITDISPRTGDFPPPVPAAPSGNRALGILLGDTRAGRPVHVEHIPARGGHEVPWPQWLPAEIVGAFAGRGLRGGRAAQPGPGLAPAVGQRRLP